ncbi:MAG: FG-GAP-like repeat-containing protein [candidate division Zixibacteria bacterium]|nr:FG-GAP-like repeat-containing protein [candidate division Zixibacteria bacterium]
MKVGKLRSFLTTGVVLLLSRVVFAQNNPFSPLRIFVPDSDFIAFDFKSIGKINGDSFGDYTYRLVSQSSLCGKQQVFRGGSVLDTIPIYELTPGGDFTSFVQAGDLNGDGYTDFLSTPSPSPCPYLPNQVTVYWGTSTGIDTIPNRLLPFPIPSSPSGSDRAEIVSNVDVNGDSFKDVLLLYLHRDSGNAVYLFNGKSGGVDSLPSWKVSTPPLSPSALRELTGMDAGDLNNDGYADIFVGKRAAFEFQDSIFGLVQIYLGGPNFTLDTIPDFVINPPTLNTSRLDSIYFGITVKFLGDLNGDFWPELAVSGPSNIYSGPPSINWQPRYQITGGGIDVGDVNGDGFLDLMNGFTTYPPPLGFGGVLFYLGGPRFDTVADAVITDQDLPPHALENIGSAVGFIGDINGDGAEEFMFLADRIPGNFHEVFMFAGNTAVQTGVEDGGGSPIPRTFELFQNSPNPFSSSTAIGFKLKSAARTESLRLEIYNLLGQKIRTLVEERAKGGERKAVWDGKDGNGKLVPSGIYLYKLSVGTEAQVKKMVIIR